MDCGERLLCGEPSRERRAKDWEHLQPPSMREEGCGGVGTVILKLNT